ITLPHTVGNAVEYRPAPCRWQYCFGIGRGRSADTIDVSADRGGGLLAQGSEACANLFAQELRLLPRAQVPALGKPVVVHQLWIGLFGPTPRSRIEFVRKDTHGSRDGDAFDVEVPLPPIFPVEPRARNRRVRQPGDRDVVENVVAREALRLPVE